MDLDTFRGKDLSGLHCAVVTYPAGAERISSSKILAAILKAATFVGKTERHVSYHCNTVFNERLPPGKMDAPHVR